MTIVIPLLLGILTVLLGRWMFGRWFNHVSVYGATWGTSLALFHIGLIRYYPLESETWMVIVAGWLAFVLGSATVVGARYSLQGNARKDPGTTEMSSDEHTLLLKTLWMTNVIVLLDAVHQLYILTRLVGNITNFFAVGKLVYTLRVHEGLPGAIPYIGSLSLPACLLAGLYTSLVGRLKLVATIPLVAMIIGSITNMTRAFIIIGALLFLTGYFLNTRKISFEAGAKATGKFRRAVLVLLVVALFVSGMEIVRGNRGMTERFVGATTTLEKLGRGAGSFLTPSVVLYVTTHHGVLNQYLKRDIENPPIGNYTFAPIWRVLSVLGFDTYVNQHPIFYRVPAMVNTGSYLRDLHADYGMAGVVAGPFLLGLLASVFWFRYERTRTLFDLMILGHIYVAVGMSLFVLATQMGNWFTGLLFGLVIASMYSRKMQRLEGTGHPLLVEG
jgi:oligosaccharide repeat unit polymerase